MLSTEELGLTQEPFKIITECRCCQVKSSVSLKNLLKPSQKIEELLVSNYFRNDKDNPVQSIQSVWCL